MMLNSNDLDLCYFFCYNVLFLQFLDEQLKSAFVLSEQLETLFKKEVSKDTIITQYVYIHNRNVALVSGQNLVLFRVTRKGEQQITDGNMGSSSTLDGDIHLFTRLLWPPF